MKIASLGKTLSSNDANTERFLRDTLSFLKANRVKIQLLNHHDDYGGYCFITRQITLSRPEYFKKSKKTWLDLYVHEYCHFLQHHFQTPIYQTYWKPLKHVISTDKELQEGSRATVKTHLHAIQNMETECCKMSIGLIRFYGLPIDTKMASKLSNAYIFYHHLVAEHCTWKSKNYYSKNILDCMPTRIQSNYANKIPEKYRKILAKCFE